MKLNMSRLETSWLPVTRWWCLSSLQLPCLAHLEHRGLLSSTLLASPEPLGNLAGWARL